ncbi:MAG TPA: hypothetical protein VGR72_08910 [Candidatus Acidoferrales bacterium]|nr:hypothetical protein [Candidatus Acidoferrales bacterium]
MTIDCPSDCAHLLTARRYEVENRKPLASGDIVFPDVEVDVDLIRRNQTALSGIGLKILKSALENPALRDPEVLAALGALAETFRTLESGIIFERPPDAPLPRALYGELANFIEELRKMEAQQAGFSPLKNSEIFRMIVFLLRVGRRESNGRPRSRAFLDFLRAQFPSEAAAQLETPRIIMP